MRSWQHAFPVSCAVVGGVLTVVAVVGCSDLRLPEAVDKGVQNAQQQVNQAVETVAQQVVPTAGVELTLTPPIKNSVCYAEWIAPAEGRPGVLTLSTYQDPEAGELYPSIFAQVRTDVPNAKDLVGKTVPADLYVRRAIDAPVLRSPRDEPVMLKITSLDGGAVTAEVVKGSVVSLDTNEAAPFLGKLSGKLQ